MKLLYLTYGEQSGVIKYLVKALSTKGIKTTIVNTREKLTYRAKGLKIPSLRPSNLFNTGLALLQYRHDWKHHFFKTTYAFKLMTEVAHKYIEKNRQEFDIILQAGVLFSASFYKVTAPYFLYLDNTYALAERATPIKGLPNPKTAIRKWKILEKSTYEKADIIFTMSKSVQDSLINDYGIGKDKIRVVGAGPNLDTIPRRQDKSYKNPTIFFVGKSFKNKGGEILLKAFWSVRELIPNARLIIVGPKEKIQGPGILWKGFVDFQSMPALYRQASLFVLPTLREAFGLSFLEAMAHQLPCIGTNIQAIPEIIDNEKTGFTVPILDETKLAEKIILLLKDEKLMKKMGDEGYNKIKEYFNWNLVASRMLSEMERRWQTNSTYKKRLTSAN